MAMDPAKTRLQQSEAGFAALVIALVLVLVLSLITVGFAQLMRKEERSALDKHLTNQAYYAAETGINDAAKAINNGWNMQKQYCDPPPAAQTAPGQPGFFLSSNTFPGNNNISYPCLLIDPTPLDVKYGDIHPDQSKVIEITGIDPTDRTTPVIIDHMVISWDSGQDLSSPVFVPAAMGHNFTPANKVIIINHMVISWESGQGLSSPMGHNFTPANNWKYAGVLRIGLTPLQIGNIKRGYLINNTYTAFLYPNNNSSPVPVQTLASYLTNKGVNGGAILDGNCNTATKVPLYSQSCSVTINNIGVKSVLLDLRSIYSNTQVTIRAYNPVLAGGPQVRIGDAQTVVDSTGKAQDVLRRVQARIPIKNGYSHPDFSLETTGNICKQLAIWPGGADPPGCSP